MRYLSLFSGIEAASVAWKPLGWQCASAAEVEPFPCAVLAHHYPDVPNFGDVTQFKEWPDAAFDVLVGGSPCQSFSVAGLRKGLDDPRGNLMLTYGAIAGRYRPRWLVWENVPGVLSSNGGRDFGTFLGMLGELGYGFAYRILDAQYLGVPQRRRRVFVVGHLGDWRRAAAVLFERHSLSGNPAPSREAGQGAPRGAARSVAIRGRDGVSQVELGDDVANAILTPSGGRCGIGVGTALVQTDRVAHALTAREGKGVDSDCTNTLIAFAGMAHARAGWAPPSCPSLVDCALPLDTKRAQAIAFRVHGDNSTAMTGGGIARVADPVDIARCLDTCGGYTSSQGGNVVMQSAARQDPDSWSDRTGPLDCDGGTQAVLCDTFKTLGITQDIDHASTKKTDPRALLRALRKEAGEEAFTKWGLGILDSLQRKEILRQAVHGSSVRPAAFSRSWVVYCALSRAENDSGWLLQSLREAGCERCASQGRRSFEQLAGELGAYLSELSQPGAQAARYMRDLWQASEGLGLLRETLSAIQKVGRPADGKGQPAYTGSQVRRLTVEECECLQGFPRGYTAITVRGKPAADGSRYKALGNSMAVPVMAWIGRRIAAVEKIAEKRIAA